MSYTVSNNNGAGTGYTWTTSPNLGTGAKTTFKSSVMLEDSLGDITDMGRAAKMFMWWMQTYHPELEFEFDAVEDTKRGIK